MNRPLADLRLAVMMLDGIDLHGYTNIVALGITTEGEKLALGLWDGSTENATVAAALLADLVDRGLRCRAGAVVRHRRIESAQESHPAGVRQRRSRTQRCTQHYADSPVMPTRPVAPAVVAESRLVRSA